MKGLTIALIGLGLWAWSRSKAAVPGKAVLIDGPVLTPVTPLPINVAYSGAAGQVAPVVSSAKDFAAVYGMSEEAAISTAERYVANPVSAEFASLSQRDMENLARIAASSPATSAPVPAATVPAAAATTLSPAAAVLIGTASAAQLNVVAAITGGTDTPAYQTAVDAAYQEAAQQAAAISGEVVSWSAAGGYEAVPASSIPFELY